MSDEDVEYGLKEWLILGVMILGPIWAVQYQHEQEVKKHIADCIVLRVLDRSQDVETAAFSCRRRGTRNP